MRSPPAFDSAAKKNWFSPRRNNPRLTRGERCNEVSPPFDGTPSRPPWHSSRGRRESGRWVMVATMWESRAVDTIYEWNPASVTRGKGGSYDVTEQAVAEPARAVGIYHSLSGRVRGGRFEGYMGGSRVAGESSRSSGIFEALSPHYAELSTATADLAILPGVFGSRTLRRAEKYVSGPSPCGCPVARPCPRSRYGVSCVMRAKESGSIPAGTPGGQSRTRW